MAAPNPSDRREETAALSDLDVERLALGESHRAVRVARAAQHRVCAAQSGQCAHEVEQGMLPPRPVEPRGLVVLTVGV
ncbi:MAG: hypothetical protein KC486_26430, partial [Myxococcales bacterium]|nr:hypothetical protein [Myxococcales bacterium]